MMIGIILTSPRGSCRFFLRLWDGLWHKDVVDDSAGQLAARI
jgi:hypothetical protein